jgi:hypothetical protein
MSRPRIAEETAVIWVRLPTDLIRRLDAYAEELRAITPGVSITRTDAARAILTNALVTPKKEKKSVSP